MLPLPLLIAATTGDDIVVTASLTPIAISSAAVSVTVFDATRIEALGEPLALDLLRLAPGVSVSVSGSRGAQTDIRIRGAEARHSLLFVDGIAFNDPAAANAARYETMTSEGLDRIEVVTGPQSALWGSEALGGVIALDSPDPIGGPTRASASGEAGGDGFRRAATAFQTGNDRVGVSGSASWMRADGIDIVGGGAGDKDGFANRSLSLKAVARPGSDGEVGIVGRYVSARTEFDGSDPLTFLRADTADASTTRTGAVRAWAKLGLAADAPWSVQLDGQFVRSRNRNSDGPTLLNASTGKRMRVGAQLVRRFMGQTLIGRIEREDEDYVTQDQQYFGLTDKNVSRGRTAFVGEWRGAWLDGMVDTDVAVRHDNFNRFKAATTWRANAAVHPLEGLTIHGGYGEGLAQPSFIDLYGFFPGNFIGNPDLKPEKSQGYEAGIRWEGRRYAIGVTAFSNRLTDEILTVFNPDFTSSTANASGKSKRRGLEFSAEARPLDGLRISANYTLLDAKELKTAGGQPIKEARRPKGSANLMFDYAQGPWTVGGSVAWVGKRRDTDFDIFADVTLRSYALASARIAYAITPNVEAFARIENAFDDRYQDVVGYAAPGRTAYAGLRVRLGD